MVKGGCKHFALYRVYLFVLIVFGRTTFIRHCREEPIDVLSKKK